MVSPRTIVVFGAGPGIGRSVAAQFASQGFDHLVLLSRNAQRLEEDKQVVAAAASSKTVRIDTATVDLSSPDSIRKALQHIDTITQDIEVVFFNGARVAPSQLFETSEDEIENDFKTTTIGLYLVAKWAIPKLQAVAKSSPEAKPSLLVTGGFLHLSPEPTFFSLSLVKTAQRNLVQSLHKVYNSQGIHVGLVLVGGIVSPDHKVFNPPNVAKVTWEFFDQKPEDWELEVFIAES